jgi:hypothetical protein
VLPILTCGVSPLWPLARCRGARTLARDGRHAAITARDASMQAVVACPLIGREIDVERQNARRKVKHSCSEVIRALTLGAAIVGRSYSLMEA